MNIKLLGAHNCESQQTRMSSIIIDNTLVLDAGGLTSCLPLSTQLEIKALLITHQHYDHIRDIPAFAWNLSLAGVTIDMYSTRHVFDVITDRLFDGEIYPTFLEFPPDNPTVRFNVIEPLKPVQIEGLRCSGGAGNSCRTHRRLPGYFFGWQSCILYQ